MPASRLDRAFGGLDQGFDAGLVRFFGVTGIPADLLQGQMNLVWAQGVSRFGSLIERFQEAASLGYRVLVSTELKQVAALAYFYSQFFLNLLNVFIEAATKVGQALRIVGQQGKVEISCHKAGSCPQK